MPVQIALADDHTLLREALAQLINQLPGYAVTHSVNNGAELMAAIDNGPPPQLVITDYDMPLMNGQEVVERLKEQHPAIRVLLLTMYDSDVILIRLMKAGASGFLKKDIHPAELKKALDETMHTGYYYPTSASARLAVLFQQDARGITPLDSSVFTEQELQFFKLSATEFTYKEIAVQMQLGPRKIDHLREELFVKIGVKTRVGLVLFAIRHGIVPPSPAPNP